MVEMMTSHEAWSDLMGILRPYLDTSHHDGPGGLDMDQEVMKVVLALADVQGDPKNFGYGGGLEGSTVVSPS